MYMLQDHILSRFTCYMYIYKYRCLVFDFAAGHAVQPLDNSTVQFYRFNIHFRLKVLEKKK